MKLSRIFIDFKSAYDEIMRDVSEMGIKVHTQTMQNKNIAKDSNYETMELQNYQYSVVNVSDKKIKEIPSTQPWADEEFKERTSIGIINPGKAWLRRKEVWEEFLNESGKFDYTYNERMKRNLLKIINELNKRPESRQLWLSIWNPIVDISNLGKKRVPCSLGYGFSKRCGKVNMIYIMRSCDIITHYHNDVYLACKLLKYVCEKTNNQVGDFNHFIFSLHAYKKDLKGIF